MQEIIQEALKNSDKEKLLRENSQVEQICDEFGQPQIVIVGCGGAGNNTVNRLYNIGVSGAETIAINTDKQHLEMVQADKKILV
ncbi:MAG: cell division protein FtsZ, partial [Methanosarcinales archaeon]|nr:cell division protein FtsZ [Methanosarcinales archaeon]